MHLASDEVQQRQRPDIGDVNVVEENDDGPLARDQREEGRRGLEQTEPLLRRIGGGRRRLAAFELGQKVCERSDPGALGLGRASGHSGERAQRLDPRPVRRRAARLPRSSPGDERAASGGLGREVVGEPRLSDPRLADEQHDRRRPGVGGAQGRVKIRELALPPEQHHRGSRA